MTGKPAFMASLETSSKYVALPSFKNSITLRNAWWQAQRGLPVVAVPRRRIPQTEDLYYQEWPYLASH